MHILGKILAWMLVLSAGAATVLMARQLEVKNGYTKQYKTLKDQNATNAKRIQELTDEVAKLDDEYEKLMHGQNIYWDRKTGNRDQRDGSLVIGAGLNDGIGLQIDSTQPPAKVQRRTSLHIFRQPAPNNPASIYVGPFHLSPKASDLGPQAAKLFPDWNVRAGEANSWQGQGATWRIWATVPTKYTTLFDTFYLQLEGLDRDIVDAGKKEAAADFNLKNTNALIAKLRTQIAGPDGTGGLVKQLSDAEEARNVVLGEVDALRRAVKKTHDRQIELEQENRKLAAQSTQP